MTERTFRDFWERRVALTPAAYRALAERQATGKLVPDLTPDR
ncbi:hypothetical protein DSM112329_01908 [Paraconexibacter sp. AEG42_29]|uniref:Uncharacterized protein n=1 Tax=Paraconexibacter sp. AEG42_29 TaxID=2997339 RepID=A0AAU7ATY5_9ACTN